MIYFGLKKNTLEKRLAFGMHVDKRGNYAI